MQYIKSAFVPQCEVYGGYLLVISLQGGMM